MKNQNILDIFVRNSSHSQGTGNSKVAKLVKTGYRYSHHIIHRKKVIVKPTQFCGNIVLHNYRLTHFINHGQQYFSQQTKTHCTITLGSFWLTEGQVDELGKVKVAEVRG